jgi:hypothetical protein
MAEKMRGFLKGEKYGFFQREKAGKTTAGLIWGRRGDPGYEMQFLSRSSTIGNPPDTIPDSVIDSDLGGRAVQNTARYIHS